MYTLIPHNSTLPTGTWTRPGWPHTWAVAATPTLGTLPASTPVQFPLNAAIIHRLLCHFDRSPRYFFKINRFLWPLRLNIYFRLANEVPTHQMLASFPRDTTSTTLHDFLTQPTGCFPSCGVLQTSLRTIYLCSSFLPKITSVSTFNSNSRHIFHANIPAHPGRKWWLGSPTFSGAVMLSG